MLTEVHTPSSTLTTIITHHILHHNLLTQTVYTLLVNKIHNLNSTHASFRAPPTRTHGLHQLPTPSLFPLVDTHCPAPPPHRHREKCVPFRIPPSSLVLPQPGAREARAASRFQQTVSATSPKSQPLCHDGVAMAWEGR